LGTILSEAWKQHILQVRFKSRTHVVLFAVSMTIFSVVVAELAVLAVYMIFGASVFSATMVAYLALVIPIAIAFPTSYVMGITGHRLDRAQSSLRELAETDELTGLINRRSFFERAIDQLDAAAAQHSPMTLLIVDADYFKQLNDSYGHATGDAALKFIAEKLHASIRRNDLACRLGGEEFAILLPGVHEEQAQPTAERILTKIAEQPMVHDGKIIEMSVSCGVADTSVSYDMTALFKAADDALYAAKDAGRNRAILFTRSLRTEAPAVHA